MSSEPIRDPVKDHLLTPENAAFIIIDDQPVQVKSIASMDRPLLIAPLSILGKMSNSARLSKQPAARSSFQPRTERPQTAAPKWRFR